MTTASATTTAGAVRGRRIGRVVHFAGVPFASAARFASPEAPRPWLGTRDASSPGPIAPQPAGRLERVMGPMRAGRQNENCLTLNLWTPSVVDGARPVLVWIHGGGFSSGSGSAEWYDGTLLAERSDLVVVTINYRLGVLGFAHLDSLAPSNRGLLDMVAALDWVQDNIAAFGGDPADVTVAGQSGGAVSIVPLLGRGLFRRAILQSAPFAVLPWSSEEAGEFTAMLCAELGLARPASLFDVPVNRLLDAQRAVTEAITRASPNPLNVAPPFQLVTDELVGEELISTALNRPRPEVDLLIGWTRDELAAFVGGDERFAAIDAETVIRAIRQWYGGEAEQRYADRLSQLPEAATPAQVALAITTDEVFRRGALRLAAAFPGSVTYRFDWRPTGSPFGACHCLDIPFVFGNAAAWRDAPMLPGGELPGRLAEAVRTTWTAFIRGDQLPGRSGDDPIMFGECTIAN
ncbi:carboxylesterase family protein [Micromonospora sp. NPDC005324]|uniref:carboxylesterase family protein n=1 Tax=Micromonospora sp. NPDC005324 TaxID=3157033 RepID=UPI0033AD8D37